MNNSSLMQTFEEVQLTYKNKIKVADRPKISCSNEAFQVLHTNWDDNQIDLVEEFKILLLDNANRAMSLANISKGGISGTVADLRVIFAIALKRRACGLILAHNHPSGSLNPSKADIALTRKIAQAGKVLDIELLDHLIVSRYAYRSLVDDGLYFS